MRDQDWLIFTGSAHPSLARALAACVGRPLASATVGAFADGEVRVVLDDPVRGADVAIVQSLNSDRAIMELLLLADAAVRAGARKVIAVIPYLRYARQDRRGGQEPLSAALMARLLETAGVNALAVLDLHSPAIEGCFTVPVIHVQPIQVFISAWREAGLPVSKLIIAAPDASGVKRSLGFCQALGGAELVAVHKQRQGARCDVLGVSGDVTGRHVMLMDDITASGQTLFKAAAALKAHGAATVYASVTHLVAPSGMPALDAAPIERLFVTDSLPLPSSLWEKLTVVTAAPLLAAALAECFVHR